MIAKEAKMSLETFCFIVMENVGMAFQKDQTEISIKVSQAFHTRFNGHPISCKR